MNTLTKVQSKLLTVCLAGMALLLFSIIGIMAATFVETIANMFGLFI